MSSISHVVSTATQSPLCNSHAHDQGPCEHAPELVRHFYPQAKSQIVTGDYLRRKWLPVYGPRFYSLIKALRGHCSYEIKEGEAKCYPSETTLARECGVTRRTIITWLARVEEGEEQKYPGLKVGDFCHPRHGKALQQFLRIKGKLRYDPAGQRRVKAANDYFVRMDDLPVPEDEPKIWARAYDLATLHLERQAEEAQRQAQEQERNARYHKQERQAREQEPRVLYPGAVRSVGREHAHDWPSQKWMGAGSFPLPAPGVLTRTRHYCRLGGYHTWQRLQTAPLTCTRCSPAPLRRWWPNWRRAAQSGWSATCALRPGSIVTPR